MRKTLAALAAILLGAAGVVVADDLTQRELRAIGEGRALYLQHCLACHGGEARGTGVGYPVPAPDLTLIAVRDNGFDRLHVKSHISFGCGLPVGTPREPGEMPAWGIVLAKRGVTRNDAAAQTAILKLVRYLEFVQLDEPTGVQLDEPTGQRR